MVLVVEFVFRYNINGRRAVKCEVAHYVGPIEVQVGPSRAGHPHQKILSLKPAPGEETAPQGLSEPPVPRSSVGVRLEHPTGPAERPHLRLRGQRNTSAVVQRVHACDLRHP